ncbi:MAG: DUF4230 domain-containing protein [Novosphingobium sp.]|uniref:DUF4230 domain-containing protein n=1 Tax=Novosphingobium sp. TaxID=1874826 RepID=UPI0030167599
MDLDRLNPPAPAVYPAPAGRQRLALLPWVLFLSAAAIAAALAWQIWKPEPIGDPLATSLVAFDKQDRLTVFSAELAPVVASDDSRLFGLVTSRQIAVIPARVDYAIDLGRVGRDRMAWDAMSHTLTVRLPALQVTRPNLDEARAQYLREGVWITRAAQDKLTRDNTRLAERLAVEQAANPVLLGLARTAAKDAIRQNLAIPLQVAGFGNVKLAVSIDGETAKP